MKTARLGLLVSLFAFACAGTDDTDDKDTDTTEETDTDVTEETDDTEDTVETDTPDTDADTDVGETSATLSGDVQPIFTSSCATGGGCHITGGTSPDLSAGNARASIVDVANGSDFDYVEPGSADTSYLVAKIEGTQAAAGGGGSRMPLTGGTLSEAEISLIRDWIDSGAADD